jgi:hypothetical protein
MRATVRLELRDAAGSVVGTRDARNSVMRAGAELVANLFAGKVTVPITHMGVGTSGEPTPDQFSSASLTTAGGTPDTSLQGDTDVPIAPGDFIIKTDPDHRLVRVQLHATLPPAAAVGTLREAGLLSKKDAQSSLYNRVTFAPIEKQDDHELTMFWEVTFPYGDLNWM